MKGVKGVQAGGCGKRCRRVCRRIVSEWVGCGCRCGCVLLQRTTALRTRW